MVKFALENADVYDEIIPLARMHAEEVTGGVTADCPLDIDVDTYRKLDQMDALRVFTARLNGALIGYAVFHVGASIYRKYMRQAHEGGVFLVPEHRSGRTAMRLLDFADAELARQGCELILYSSPVANPKFGAMLAKRGFEKVDEVYARRV